jgi:hypothetical protein
MVARFCDETDQGFSWVVDEPMTRTSHALAADGRVWLVDPVAWEPAIERLAGLGEAAGVIQLLDRHNRDCAALARRLDVPHLATPDAVPESPFEVLELVDRQRWRERALWWPDAAVLVVAEAVGTNSFFTGGKGAAGVHLLLRPFPPRDRLRGLEPRHLLVGHGEGLHGEAASRGLREALETSRTGLPRMLVRLPGLAVRARRRAPGDQTRA